MCGLLAVALAVLAPRPAFAACDQTGSTVNCTGTTTNYNAGSQGGVTFTVQPGATIQGVGGTSAFSLTNPTFSADRLINNGTIDGLVDIVSSVPGVDSFTNNGVLKITDPLTNLTSHSLFGTDFTQSSSGTFMARVDSAGFNDSLLVNSATLAGRLIIVVQPGLYTSANTYTIITSTNTIVGAFDSASVTSPFFTLSLSTCACNLDATLTPIAFNAVPGLTSNQQAVADVLQNLYASGTPTGSLGDFYSNLFAATSVNVFDQLSGAGTAAAQNASFGAAGLFNDAMLQQGLAFVGGAPGGGAFGAPLQYAAAADKSEAKPGYEAFAAVRRAPDEKVWRAWAVGFGSTRSIDGSSGTADQSMQTAGGSFGVERSFGPDLLLGFAAGGSGSHFSVSSLSTSGSIDGAHVGAYLAKRWDDIYALATVNYARFDNTTERTISGVGPTENAQGRFSSDQLGGRFELGWRRRIGEYAITPFVAVEPAALWQQAYTESSTVTGGGAGVLALSYAARETTSLPAFVGAQLNTRYLVGAQTVQPFVRAAWVHEFMTERQVQAAFVSIPAPSFTVDGTRPARDAARISGGASWTIDAAKAVFARVDSELSGSGVMLAGTVGARISW